MNKKRLYQSNPAIPEVASYPYRVAFVCYENGLRQYEVTFLDFSYVVGSGKTKGMALKEARENLRSIFSTMAKHGDDISSPDETQAKEKGHRN